MMITLKGREPKLNPLPGSSLSLTAFRWNADEQSKVRSSNIRQSMKSPQNLELAGESMVCNLKKHGAHTLGDKAKATLSEQHGALNGKSNDITTFKTKSSPFVHQGDNNTTSETSSITIKEKVYKIMIDLRPALSQVNQSYDTYEDRSPDHGELEDHKYPKLKTFKMTGKHKEANHQTKNGLKPCVKEASGEARLTLPKLVINKQSRDGNTPCLSAAVRKNITQAQAQAQATEDGILPSISNLNLDSTQPNCTVLLPKIILQHRHQSQLPLRGKLSDKAERQYLSFPPDLQIPVPQLLQQVKENTSSRSHVLIAQVLRSLREGLWLDSSLSVNEGNNFILDSCERRPYRLNFRQNSKKTAVECLGRRHPKSEFPDEFPVEMRSFQPWTYPPKLHMKSNLTADHGTV